MHRFRLAARPTGILLVVLAWCSASAQPAAADTYWWNASGTDWTSPNAWNLNASNGPAATWVNGNDAFFMAGGTVQVSTAITAASLVFDYPSQVTITAAGGTLTLFSPGASTITVASTAGATINAPLGITVFRNSPINTNSVLTLGGANTFTGPLTLAGGGAFTDEVNTLRMTATSAVPSTADIRFDARNAALVFAAGLPAAFTLPNNIVLNQRNASGSLPNYIRSATQTDATLSGLISGTGGLIVATDTLAISTLSTFRLTHANTYTGGTTVQAGLTLLVNNPIVAGGSATGMDGVTAGAGRVGGIGRIAGFVAGTGDGLRVGGTGRLAPGDPTLNNGVGVLYVTNRSNLIAGGTFEVKLGGLTDTDTDRNQLRCNSTINFDVANANVKIDVAKVGSVSFTPGQVYTYRIAQPDVGITMPAGAGGQFDPSKLTITSSFDSPANFALSYQDLGGTDHYLVLTYTVPVPEPAFGLAVGAAVLGFGLRRSRRSRLHLTPPVIA
jgi:autotransporter-associated beta strand protein